MAGGLSLNSRILGGYRWNRKINIERCRESWKFLYSLNLKVLYQRALPGNGKGKREVVFAAEVLEMGNPLESPSRRNGRHWHGSPLSARPTTIIGYLLGGKETKLLELFEFLFTAGILGGTRYSFDNELNKTRGKNKSPNCFDP